MRKNMSLENFKGKTFVAFVDISGFKKKLKKKPEKAIETLGNFYNIGYKLLAETGKHKDISGVFVSDCAILYVHNKTTEHQEKICSIKKMLNLVKEFNEECIRKNIILTTNITYGDFEYKKRLEVGSNIGKELFAGNAYLNAYIDSENEMKACYCRILKKGLVDDNDTSNNITNSLKETYVFSEDDRYYYFWWQCKSENEIKKYKKEYTKEEKLYNERKEEIEDEKFENICNLTKRYSDATE